jgi:hypothetical protein
MLGLWCAFTVVAVRISAERFWPDAAARDA